MKRTLAILLATLMTLSMFAIGASAVAKPAAMPGIDKTAAAGNPYKVTIFDAAAEKETEIADGSALDPGMILEPKVEASDAFKAEDDVALDSNDLKLLWYVGNDKGEDPDFTKAGTEADSFKVLAADLNKFVYLALVVDVNANKVINAADSVYFVFKFGPVNTLNLGKIEDDLFELMDMLVACKVVNEEYISGLGLSMTIWEALEPFTGLSGAVDNVNKAYKAALDAVKAMAKAAVPTPPKVDCGICAFCLAPPACPTPVNCGACLFCDPPLACLDPQDCGTCASCIAVTPPCLTPDDCLACEFCDPQLIECEDLQDCGAAACPFCGAPAACVAQVPGPLVVPLSAKKDANTKFQALIDAIAALKKAADAVVDKIIDNAGDRLNECLDLMESVDQSELNSENKVTLIKFIAELKEAQLNLAQAKRILDSDTDLETKYDVAQAVVAKVQKLLAKGELLEAMLKLGSSVTTPDDDALKALEEALKAAEEALKAAEDALKDALDNPTIIEKPVVVVVPPEWYDVGIYKLLGVGKWPGFLQSIMFYVFFGWRFAL